MVETIPTVTGPSDTTWAVVVVHGVGHTDPGATLGALIPTIIKATDGALEEIEPPKNCLLSEHLAESPPGIALTRPNPTTETLLPPSERFPMHVRQFRVARDGQPGKAAFAEVFWADLAAGGEARSDLVRRLFSLIFDLRHIPNVAASYPRVAFVRALRWLLYSASWLLIGPIAGATLFMAYLFVAHYAAVNLLELFALHTDQRTSELGVGLLGLGAVLVAMLLGWYRRTESEETWTLLITWFGVAAIVICVVAIGRLLVVPSWPFNTPLGRIAAGRLLVVTPENLSTLSTHVVVLFSLIYTTFVLLALVMAAACGVWLLARVAAIRRDERGAGPPLDMALGTTLLQVEVWVVIAAALGSLVLSRLYPEYLNAPLFTMMVTGFTLKLIFAMLILLCGAAVWAWRWFTITRLPHQAVSPLAPELPRLLVHPGIMYLLIALTLFALVSFAVAVGFGYFQLHEALKNSSRLVVQITVPVITVLGFLFRKGLGSWLHIMADITNHFFRPHSTCPWPWKPTDDPRPEAFTRQWRSGARFRRVLEEIVRSGHVSHVTVVAHSQGTMTAIDMLRLDWAARLLAGREVYLMTMGSPFTNLYQYYFPHRYPPLFTDRDQLTHAWGSSLRRTVRAWTNIYRVDDFIGTRIAGDRAGEFPINRCFAPGGHTAYWQQREIVELMLPYLPGGAKAPSAPQAAALT